MDKIVGHSEIINRFRRSLLQNRLASTFLFVGPEGIGKRTFARELAKALLCPNINERELDSCGHCESCRLFDAEISKDTKHNKDVDLDLNNHPDFKFVHKRENKSSLLIEQFIGKDDRRNKEGMVHDICLSPTLGKRKIAVIDDGDFFNQECANCLLKTLEEPPPRSVLIIIGTCEQKQLPTIRSRCQIVHFHPLSTEEVKTVLQNLEGHTFSAGIDEIAKRSKGSLKILQQYEDEGLLDFRTRFLKQLSTCDLTSDNFTKEFSSFVDQAGKDATPRRNRVRQLADFAIEFYQAIGLRLSGVNDLTEGDPELSQSIEQAVKRWNVDVEYSADCIDRCLDVHQHLAANANMATMLECWLSDLGKLSRGESSYRELKPEYSY